MFDMQPLLHGELVRLRPLIKADYDALYSVASDPELWKLHPARDRWQEPIFRRLFQASLESGGAMVVIDNGSDRIIGSSRYNLSEAGSGRAEIGWSFLSRSHWGGAWNREVKRLLLAHAFRFVETVYFRVGETNLRSRRAMEKLGARLADRTDILTMPDGTPVTHVIYEISKGEFDAPA
ncbi:acetyltransferase [Rhizobium sp. Root1203]|uniref:GNAT family N-acetyltransferase n=1 Tax=Rhizobium sp. Root1203 TaxID=1736427 RepID=UPI00070C93E9|nr:GNAT family N-acetyltransferase [Rhizobium sp. Root1203]KQV28390.1 acetyltransferase [Rhizobium sp. Root1203]